MLNNWRRIPLDRLLCILFSDLALIPMPSKAKKKSRVCITFKNSRNPLSGIY